MVTVKTAFLNLSLILSLILGSLSLAQTTLPPEAQTALARGGQSAALALATYEDHFIDKPLWREAVNYGLEAQRLAPNNPQPYRFLGQVYSNIAFYARAWSAWTSYTNLGGEMTAQTAPYLKDASSWLGNKSFREENYQDAILYYSKLHELEPTSEEANQHLALSHIALSSPSKAEPFLETLTTEFPNKADYINLLSRTEEQVTYGVDATNAYHQGLSLYAEGNKQAALNAFRQSVEANENFATAFVWAGRISSELGQLSPSLSYWQQAARLEPNNQEAQEAQRATQLNSSYGEAWAWLGQLSVEARDFQNAVTYYNSAIRLEPNNTIYTTAYSQSQRLLCEQLARQAPVVTIPPPAVAATTVTPPQTTATATTPSVATQPQATPTTVTTTPTATTAPPAAVTTTPTVSTTQPSSVATTPTVNTTQPSSVAATPTVSTAQPATVTTTPTVNTSTATNIPDPQASVSTTAPINVTAPTSATVQPPATYLPTPNIASPPTPATNAAANVAQPQLPSPQQTDPNIVASVARPETPVLTPTPAPSVDVIAPQPVPVPPVPEANIASGGPAVSLLSVNYTHDTADNGGSGAFSFFNSPSSLLSDLNSPVDYASGTLHQRIEVASKPSGEAVLYEICLVHNGDLSIGPACTQGNSLRFEESGVYETAIRLSSFSNYNEIDWSKGLQQVMLIIKDKDGNTIDDRFLFKNNNSQEISLADFYPMQVNYKAILVPAGGNFPGW